VASDRHHSESLTGLGTTHGFRQHSKQERYGEDRYWLVSDEAATPPRSDMQLADDMLATLGDGGLGRTVYRFASSFIHTQSHAFTLLLPAVGQHDAETPDAVPLGVDLDDLKTWLVVVIAAADTATERCGLYFGWNMGEWSITVRPFLARWWVAQGA
jgi:hypothetical protein